MISGLKSTLSIQQLTALLINLNTLEKRKKNKPIKIMSGKKGLVNIVCSIYRTFSNKNKYKEQ